MRVHVYFSVRLHASSGGDRERASGLLKTSEASKTERLDARLLFTTPAESILETLHGEVSANLFTDGGFLFSLVGVGVDGEVFHGGYDFGRRRLDGRARRERTKKRWPTRTKR